MSAALNSTISDHRSLKTGRDVKDDQCYPSYQITSNNPVRYDQDLNTLCERADDKAAGGYQSTTQCHLTDGESVQQPTNKRTCKARGLYIFSTIIVISQLPV